MKLSDTNKIIAGTFPAQLVTYNSSSFYSFHSLRGPYGIRNATLATPIMWFDASDSTTLFADVAGTTLATPGQAIARWNSKVGNYSFQQPTVSARPILVENSVEGLSVVNMGSLTSGQFLFLMLNGAMTRYEAANHTIFFVTKGSNFLLGDNVFYDFHRGLVANQLGAKNAIWDSSFSQVAIRNGITTLNRAFVNGTTTGLTGGYDVVGLSTASGTARFNNLGADRGYSFRTGGMEYAEIIIYPGVLNANDRAFIEFYLSDKWQGSKVESIVSRSFSGTLGLEKTGLGNLTLVGVNGYTGQTIIRSGSLKVSYDGLINNTSSIINNGSLIINKNNAAIILPAITGNGSIEVSVLGARLTSNGNITGSTISIVTSFQLGARGFFLAAGAARTITGTSISVSGQIGQASNSPSSLTMDTSEANGPITIAFQNGESGWWFGLQSITANAGVGTVTVSGARPSAENFSAVNGTTLTGSVVISTSATWSLSGNLNINSTRNSTISSAINIPSGRVYNLNVSLNFTLSTSAVLGGAGAALVKSGLGSLNMGAITHAYTGSTVISSGEIIVSKTAGGITGTARYTPTTLTVDFNGIAPVSGNTYKFFPGSTSPTNLTISLINAGGKTSTYNYATSTLTIN